MDLSDVMTAIAAHLDDAKGTLGIAGASYPQLNTVPASPYVMVLDGSSAGPTTYERGMDGHHVTGRVTIRVLVKSHKDTPREASRIDGLIAPILDALDPVLYGGSANHVLDTLTDHLDRIWDTATVVRGATEEYAGEFCYAADIGIDPAFTRTPEV